MNFIVTVFKHRASVLFLVLSCCLLSFQSQASPYWRSFASPFQASASAFQPVDCSPAFLDNNSNLVLGCFLQEQSDTPPSWQLINTKSEASLRIYTYSLVSQFWPQKNVSGQGKNWTHELVVYVPEEQYQDQALLYLDGGTNVSAGGESIPIVPLSSRNDSLTSQQLSNIALRYGSIVAHLRDLPNQYLTFDDGVARKEDGVVAYTWNQYMNDPASHAYWPVFLPMVKAAQEAMDVIQEESFKQSYEPPRKFVISGASKRGWAAWLTALADNRVNGLIPIVIDILNTKQNLQHIYKSLGQQWPLAFYDYVTQGVVDRIDSIEFDKLTKIIDPIRYRHNPRYGHQLEIPKFIINASSDDFFAPDSLLQYIDDLPGQNTLRILPNQRHYADIKLVGQAMSDYYGLFLAQTPIPNITWARSADNRHIEVTTHFVPEGEVTLWQAYNPTVRDFRIYPTNISYSSTSITGECKNEQCTYRFPEVTTTTGYTARFLELTYAAADGHHLVVTSPVFVTPDTYPVAQ